MQLNAESGLGSRGISSLIRDIGYTALLTVAVMSGYWVLHIPPWSVIPVGVLICVVFLPPIERLVPVGPHKPMSIWLLNLRINVLYLFMSTVVGVVLIGPLMAVVSRHFSLGLIDLRFTSGRGGMLDVLSASLLSLFVWDFFFYWYHRLMHAVPFLWQIHKLHHMDTQLDALSNNRENWLDPIIFTPMVVIPPAVLFKIDSYEANTLGTILSFAQLVWPMLYHSNIRLEFGKASVLINCNQVHRIHHSRLPEHRDRNFAAYFPLWDVIFRTYTHPTPGVFAPTGVEGETEIHSLLEASLLPILEWWRNWRHRRATAST